MSNTRLYDNPYVPPEGSANYEMRRELYSSKVLPCAYLGAFLGIGTQAVIQLMIAARTIPQNEFDAGYLSVLQSIHPIAMIFSAIVSGTCFAILGSIAGALLDTFYSTQSEGLDEQHDASNSP